MCGRSTAERRLCSRKFARLTCCENHVGSASAEGDQHDGVKETTWTNTCSGNQT
ncbi:hypothetical protein PC116_g15970 [Phytophthora cactorum]|nr:hypothetical protein C6341_g12269 [Phytophthora cactorum]KAG3180417.1 hypothetical protein PC128_g15580 [Phytophthora cactorum]KAG4235915.1 hypothetical protein PC116_g15970 [Phytophthora cactorum]